MPSPLHTYGNLIGVMARIQGGGDSLLHPLQRPVIALRETLHEDASFLVAAAESMNFRTVNFPTNLAELDRKITLSRRSFRGEVADLGTQEFMFTVLSGPQDEAIPIGSSTFYPQHGTPERPHTAYQIVRRNRILPSSRDLVDDSLLVQTLDHDGPAAVGALMVHRAVRGRNPGRLQAQITIEGIHHTVMVTGGYGRAASYVRFFWAALPENRPLYQERDCLAEILPPFETRDDGGRTNPFYDSFAAPLLDHRPYDEMDRETFYDRSLITDRFPKFFALNGLPEEASRQVAQVDRDSRPALSLLEALGFHFSGQIDSLDGGPHYRGEFAKNPIFMGAREVYFGGIEREYTQDSPWQYGFLGGRTEGEFRFRACLGPYFILGDELFVTEAVQQFLRATVGNRLTVSPIL